jgi:hypothetical protein
MVRQPIVPCGLLATAMLVLSAAPAMAQRSGSTSTAGAFSQATSMFQSSLQGTGTGGLTGTGATGGFGASSFGSSMGQAGMGGAGGMTGGMGQGGMGQTGGLGMTGGLGATGAAGQSTNGFLGANNNPNSFLGRNTQGQNANFNTNQGGQRNRGGQQRGLDQQLMNLLNGNGQGQYGGNNLNSQNTGVRPRQKIAFEHPAVPSHAVVTTVQTRFVKLSDRYPHLKGVDLTVAEDGVVVLRGEVASQHQAKVTESLVRLEPGVKTVRNELSYPSAPAAQ